LSGILVPQLRGTPCRARIANSKVRSGPRPAVRRRPRGMYSYPDLFVICGELQYHDEYKDVIVNPTAIFEVLSESTEKFDRGEKFLRYQNYNHSLQDYLLVSQLSPTIEHYTRQADGSWNYRVYTGLRASFTIKSIKCQVKLAEVYERVKFPPSAAVEETANTPRTGKRSAARAKTKTSGRTK
jgi:Uma2 family endonuclease